MTCNPTNKIDRKALARELADEIGAEAKYLRVPTCAYQVGPYTINKDASITGDDLEAIRAFLIRHDYIHQEPVAEAVDADQAPSSGDHPSPNEHAPAAEETQAGSSSANAQGGAQDADQPSSPASNQPNAEEGSMGISISELSPTALANLIRLVYARQDLINAMTKSDALSIDEEVIDLLNETGDGTIDSISKMLRDEARIGMIRGIMVTDGQLTFSFPFDPEHSELNSSSAKLVSALVERAKAAKRVNARRIEPAGDEMKYFCNSMLTQLGFGGSDFKADRAALLGHLSGYAAFRSSDKMEAHKHKYAKRKDTKNKLE